MLTAIDYSNLPENLSEEEMSEWSDIADPNKKTMHVKPHPKGPWHRPALNIGRTACGIPLAAYATRDESYEGELCHDGCFTQYELKLAMVQRNLTDAEERAARERESRPLHPPCPQCKRSYCAEWISKRPCNKQPLE